MAIESDLQELAFLYQDLGLLVEDQGEQLDTIETNVKDANVEVQKGVEDLREANRLQRAIRAKFCWLILCCLLVLGVIMGATGVFSS